MFKLSIHGNIGIILTKKLFVIFKSLSCADIIVSFGKAKIQDFI